MKKIIAILLSLALLLGCAAGLAEGTEAEVEKHIFGAIRANGEFTLKGVLPEGYKVVPFELSEDSILTRIVSDDPTKPVTALSIAFDESYSDVQRLNDLDDDALAAIEKTFTDTDPYANITYDETAYGTRLLVCRTTSETYDYLTLFSIYKGYCVEFVMTPGREAPEQHLTDEDVANCNVFLSELDFVEGFEETEAKIEGNTFTALINGFDAEARTIDVALLKAVVMTEWQAVSINEGDTIRIGTEDVEIGTLSYDGDDAVINDEYYLRRNSDGLYNPYSYDYPIMETVRTMTLTVSDSVVFAEDIDPEDGDPLDEAKELTADDLFAELEAAKSGGVGFDAQNVRITFDENGEPARIERFYTPWQ